MKVDSDHSKPVVLTGRARIVPDANVDTDMIFHNRRLHITKLEEMGKYIFENLEGRSNFPAETNPGDILICGKNFGCGSSRQQAVDGFIALGVAAVVGESFGAIYRRNAINAGWPLIEAPGVLSKEIVEGERIMIDLESGEIKNEAGVVILCGNPLTDVQREIYQAGGLLELV